MVTARDVARRAGVSTSTVSHVANGTRLVSTDLTERVRAAMAELGYEPNAVARSLKIKRSHAIALIISDIENPFFTAVARGVEDAAQARGYTLILGNSDEDAAKEEAYLRLLAARRVDGLIVSPAGGRYPYLERVVHDRRPLVFIDRGVPGLPVPVVQVDSVAASRAAVEHLIGQGHRRIAMIGGRPDVSSTTARVDGYRAALRAAGIPYEPGLVVYGAGRRDRARAVTDELLDRSPRPTALFVGNNLMTIGALEAIERRSLRIPRDVALVGFDDLPWADAFWPRLTAVAQPTEALGRTAVELLVQRIEHGSDEQVQLVLLPARLVVRESSGRALVESR